MRKSCIPALWTRERIIRLAVLAGMGILQATAALIVSLYASRLLAGLEDAGAKTSTMVVVASSAVIFFGLKVAQRRCSEAFALHYVSELRAAYLSHVLRLPETGKPLGQGLILSRVVNDMSAIKLWLANGLVAGLVAIIMIATIGVYLAVSLPEAAWPLAPACGLWLFLVITCIRPLSGRIRNSRRARGRIAGFAGRIIASRLILLAYGRLGATIRTMNRRSGKLNRALVGRATVSGIIRAASDLVFPVTAIALATGAGIRLDAESLGFLILVTGLVANQLNAIALGLDYRVGDRVAMARIKNIMGMDAIDMRTDRQKMPRARSGLGISVRNVPVGSPPRPVNIDVKAGQRYALTGLSDCDTFDLILKISQFRPVDAGEIRLDGRNAQDIPTRDIWRNLAIVSDRLPDAHGSAVQCATLGARRQMNDSEKDRILAKFGLSELDDPPDAVTRIRSQRTQAAIRAARCVMRQPGLVVICDSALVGQTDLFERLVDELIERDTTIVAFCPPGQTSLLGFQTISLYTDLGKAA